MDTLRAVERLAAELPDGADISGLDFDTDGQYSVVTIQTRTPDLVIGRKGVTAQRVQSVLAEVLGADVRLSVVERRDKRAP